MVTCWKVDRLHRVRRSGGGEQPLAVWLVHPNGTDKHRLVWTGHAGHLLDYSPDGRKILFSRCGEVHCSEWVARTDGSKVSPAPCQGVFSYSPNGSWFLTSFANEQGHGELARVLIASCSRKVIPTPGAGIAGHGSWQPLPGG